MAIRSEVQHIPIPSQIQAWTVQSMCLQPTVDRFQDNLHQEEMIPSYVLSQAQEIDQQVFQRYRRMGLSPTEQSITHPGEAIIVQYDGDFDLKLYEEAYGITDPLVQQKRLNELDVYIKTQLKTHLGERLHVRISTTTYNIDTDYQLFSPVLGKIVAMVRTGIAHQLNLTGVNEIDIPRLRADEPEMELVEDTLCNPSTPLGTTIIALSPPGGRNIETGQESMFLHNFIDIFRLEEINGERVIKLYRYASTLTYEEDLHKLIQLKNDYFKDAKPGEDLVAFFLTHPIIVSSEQKEQSDPESIHRFFRKEDQFMTTAIFEDIVLPGCEEMINKYINLLHQYATTQRRDRGQLIALQHAIFNMLLIKADELVEQFETIQGDGLFDMQAAKQVVEYALLQTRALTDIDILREGKQENVKQTAGDCPGKSGMATSFADLSTLSQEPVLSVNNSLQSLYDANGLDSDEFGSLQFTCTRGHLNRRPPHIKIPKCTYPNCGEKFTC